MESGWGGEYIAEKVAAEQQVGLSEMRGARQRGWGGAWGGEHVAEKVAAEQQVGMSRMGGAWHRGGRGWLGREACSREGCC